MNNKTKISITIDPKIWDSYKKYCDENCIKYSTKLERLIQEYLFNGEKTNMGLL